MRHRSCFYILACPLSQANVARTRMSSSPSLPSLDQPRFFLRVDLCSLNSSSHRCFSCLCCIEGVDLEYNLKRSEKRRLVLSLLSQRIRIRQPSPTTTSRSNLIAHNAIMRRMLHDAITVEISHVWRPHLRIDTIIMSIQRECCSAWTAAP